MITHYDMTTGEVIEEGPVETAADGTRSPEASELRLLSIDEAVATAIRAPRLPADIAMLPVQTLLKRWS